jgi:DnaJ-class molecular chaperone
MIAKIIISKYIQDCRDCGGTGWYFIVKCKRCNNTGKEIKPSITDLLPAICEEAGVSMFEIKLPN